LHIYCPCFHSQDFPTISLSLECENGNHFNLLIDKIDTVAEKSGSTTTEKEYKRKQNNQKEKNKAFKEFIKIPVNLYQNIITKQKRI